MSWIAGCRRFHRRYEREAEHFLTGDGTIPLSWLIAQWTEGETEPVKYLISKLPAGLPGATPAAAVGRQSRGRRWRLGIVGKRQPWPLFFCRRGQVLVVAPDARHRREPVRLVGLATQASAEGAPRAGTALQSGRLQPPRHADGAHELEHVHGTRLLYRAERAVGPWATGRRSTP
ncbi:hypothetical protein Slala03_76620 [Streptomyces lavendulae subsp. lavendulae]|nr:hypothetical protein Slala03_76620 [Streptomyces lavendulae subsp. lavendulae]